MAQPIGPLMMEHRLIERMIALLKNELQRITSKTEVNSVFINNAVDFMRIYADRTHHGKEEDILFRELKKKKISKQHETMMNDLINDHMFARKTTGELVKANQDHLNGISDAINIIIEKLAILTEFYPKHIEKEDKHFFIPVMEYFTQTEKNNMLEEGQVYDRRMIHRKYNSFVLAIEEERQLITKRSNDTWINYM